MSYIYNTTVILRFRHDHHYIALSGLRKTMNLSYLNLFKVRKTLSHLALSCKPTLPSQTDVKIKITHFEKKNVLNTCTLCLSGSRLLLLLLDNGNEKTSSTVFNPIWAWLGAVVAILLLSTALVVIRKFKHNRRNTTNEDDHATNSEVVTGYVRFWNRILVLKHSIVYKNWNANVIYYMETLT